MAGPKKRQVGAFLAQQVLTAPKEQLLLMLVDGAVRFTERAKVKLAEKDFEAFGTALVRSQRIMMELICSLRKDVIGEELYNKLVGLYHFVYTRLVDAKLKREVAMMDEALKILNMLRNMWHEAVEKDRQERLENKPTPRSVPAKPITYRPPAPRPGKPAGGLSITG